MSDCLLCRWGDADQEFRRTEVWRDELWRLTAESGADLVYVTVFGERVAHLHFTIAPHRDGDALAGGPGMLRHADDPPMESQLREVAGRVRVRLN